MSTSGHGPSTNTIVEKGKFMYDNPSFSIRLLNKKLKIGLQVFKYPDLDSNTFVNATLFSNITSIIYVRVTVYFHGTRL